MSELLEAKVTVNHRRQGVGLGIAQEFVVGKAAVFLASDASSFITGVELFADGGMAQV